MAARIFTNVPTGFDVPGELLEHAAGAALERDAVHEGELSITCLPDEPIRSLNRRWLGHDWVPDVLSFSLHEPGGPPVGDIYIGIEQAARQADEHGVPMTEELARLAVHGTLHVLGYDHPEDAGSRSDSELYRIQEALVRKVLGETPR